VSLLQKCRHYFSSFYVKLFALLLVVVPTAAIAGDFIYASAVTPALQRQSERIIDEFDNHDLPPDEILRSMDKLGLAWLYVSDTAGNINPKYKAFAPDIKEYRPESRPLAWHGQRYYEVTAVKDNRVYHAGYRMEPLYDLLRGARVPVGYIALIFGAMALATAACFHILVSNPLKALPSRLHRVLTGAQNDRSEVEGLLVASQITSLDRELAEIADAQRQKLTKELSDVKNDLREVIQRERQQKFSNALLADLHEADSTESVLQVAMHRVQDRFPGQISAGHAQRVFRPARALRADGGTNQDGRKAEEGRCIRETAGNGSGRACQPDSRDRSARAGKEYDRMPDSADAPNEALRSVVVLHQRRRNDCRHDAAAIEGSSRIDGARGSDDARLRNRDGSKPL
jgi:uncharacterized membrane protein